MSEGRQLDACAPLRLWSPSSALSTTKRGLIVETQIAHDSLARGSITLRLSEIECDDTDEDNVVGEPMSVTCSLETGECTAHEYDKARFLFRYAWLNAALLDKLPHLRERAARGAAQADRETAAARALANANPKAMIAYDALFPADWDLVVAREGSLYWAVDLYCHNPHCTCTDVTISFYQLATDAKSPPFVGHARIEIADDELNVVDSSPEVDELVDELLDEYDEQLFARHEEARRVILRFGRALRRPAPAALPPPGRTPRNAMCPCGSGKKYKRCCINAPATSS